MRSNLAGIRARVERVADSVRCGECSACDGRPVQVKVSYVWEDDQYGVLDPREPTGRPTKDMPRVCVCGREVEYVHIVHRIRWESSVSGAMVNA